jgi:hypothetical protein
VAGMSEASRGQDMTKTTCVARLVSVLTVLAFAVSLTPRAESESSSYPLAICIVSGDKLDKDAVVFTYQGREIMTCCTNCIDEFYKDPAGYSAKVDEAASRSAN